MTRFKVVALSRHSAGVSLLELLVAMSVFSLLIVGLSQFFSINTRISKQQILGAEAGEVSELSLLRMSEVLLQAHYIYPANQTISITPVGGLLSRTLTTGSNALALLVPSGTTYCPGTTKTYCGFIYSIEDRSAFSSILTTEAKTDKALIEWRTSNLLWAKNVFPSVTISTWTNVSWGVLADSVDASASDLASVQKLTSSRESSIYDDDNAFSLLPSNRNAANGLILGVEPSIAIRYGSDSKLSSKSSYIFSRAIPRASLPNP